MFLLTKLKKRWNLLYKTIIWAVFLGLTALLGFPWYGWAVLVITALWAYFSSLKTRIRFRVTYIITIIFSVILLLLQTGAADKVINSNWSTVILTIILSIIMYGIFGLFEDEFLNENLVYKIINTSILIFIFISMFVLATPFSFGVFGALIFIIMSCLFNEVFRFFAIPKKERIASSLTFGLLTLELGWVVSLLPIGILNASAFMALVFSVGRDVLDSYFKKTLDSKFIFQQLTFLVIVSIVIFAASTWGI